MATAPLMKGVISLRLDTRGSPPRVVLGYDPTIRARGKLMNEGEAILPIGNDVGLAYIACMLQAGCERMVVSSLQAAVELGMRHALMRPLKKPSREEQLLTEIRNELNPRDPLKPASPKKTSAKKARKRPAPIRAGNYS